MKILVIIFFVILLLPFSARPAEILQINSANTLTIGDNNRTYKVQIACLEVDSSKEGDTVNWLRKNLPRKTKVNIKPRGFKDGTLIASLVEIKSNQDIAESLEEKDLGRFNCYSK